MIRRMSAADIPSAMRLKQAAGWNQTARDWANLLWLEPEGCWVWEEDGCVAGTATAVCYGRDLAWIGMVLVLPEFRGRGIARRLMEHCLAWLERRGVRHVMLDATDMGRPLYEKLGFRTERIIERWGAPGGLTGPAPAGELPLDAIATLDRGTFGVDRTRLMACLLEAFPGQGVWREDQGFCLGRPGANAYYLGPCAATGPQAAAGLLAGVMAQAGAVQYFWDLYPEQEETLELARSLGFARRRSLHRMTLGAGPGFPARRDLVFGAAGFEYG